MLDWHLQVLLIGDTAPNTDSQIPTAREMRGEGYWRNTRFATPTSWANETGRLVDSDVKCHTFHLREGAAEVYGRIARCVTHQSLMPLSRPSTLVSALVSITLFSFGTLDHHPPLLSHTCPRSTTHTNLSSVIDVSDHTLRHHVLL